MLSGGLCKYEEVNGVQITITTENEKNRNLKDEIDVLEKEMTEEKLSECIEILDSVEDGEEKDELKFNLRNIAQAIKAKKKLEELEAEIENMDRNSIDSFIYLDKHCGKIKKGIRYWSDKESRKPLLERYSKIEEVLTEMKNAFSEEKMISDTKTLVSKMNMQDSVEYLKMLSKLNELNGHLKKLYKKDLKEQIYPANEKIVDIMAKDRSEDIVKGVITALGLKEDDSKKVTDDYLAKHKNKKYRSLEDINQDIIGSVSLIGIKESDDSNEINEIIINQGNVEYINAGKNVRDKIAKEVLKNKDNMDSLDDLKGTIDEVISASQAEADKIMSLEKFELIEKLTELVPEIDEKFMDVIVENLKNRRIKCVEDIKEAIKNIIDREKNKTEKAGNTMTITVDFD